MMFSCSFVFTVVVDVVTVHFVTSINEIMYLSRLVPLFVRLSVSCGRICMKFLKDAYDFLSRT